jgi:glyoxylase I family protein
MLKTRRIGAIFYLVANLDRTEAFYRDAVGLSVRRTKGEHGEPDWLTAATAGGVDLLFFQGDPKPGNSPIPVFELSEGGIDAVVDGLVRAGATLVTPVSHAPGGWSSEVADPDGYQFSMFQAADKPR